MLVQGAALAQARIIKIGTQLSVWHGHAEFNGNLISGGISRQHRRTADKHSKHNKYKEN